jgi:hypothetical protein
VDFDVDQTYPSLRRLHLNINSALHSSLAYSSALDNSFWKTITHLEVFSGYEASSEFTPFISPVFSTLPQLTHFAIIIPCSPPSEMPLALSRIRASFPPSLQFCILGLIDWAQHSRDDSSMIKLFSQINSGAFDDRIVWWPEELSEVMHNPSGREAFALWGGVPDGTPTVWDLGEEALRKRKSEH